jgi:hypothetical protein
VTRKDFVMIATVINNAMHAQDITVQQAEDLADDFAIRLRSTNPRFDRERFIAACVKRNSK